MTLDPPWRGNFYDPALFDANAGDADDAATLNYYLEHLKGAPCKVLDVGCGTGRLSMPLIERGHRVHGLELSDSMLGYLRAKAERLPEDSRARLSWRCGNVLELEPEASYDVLVAMDDFVTHFDLDELARFFARAREWLMPGGRLLADMRERDPARLEVAARPLPKPMLSHGLSAGIATDAGPVHAAMMGWEEYDPDNRWLVSHQLFSFIGPDGIEQRREWKTIRQRNHSNAELLEAARSAGFALVESISREGRAPSEQGGLFQWVRR